MHKKGEMAFKPSPFRVVLQGRIEIARTEQASSASFYAHQIGRKPSAMQKKSRPHWPGFSLLPSGLRCARPRFKNSTLARSSHSASRTQRTEKPLRGLR